MSQRIERTAQGNESQRTKKLIKETPITCRKLRSNEG
jgi:hypothetical protein